LIDNAELEHELAEMRDELADQEIKLKRASVQARRISRDLRSGNPGQPTFEEVHKIANLA
jgi:flagellar hook-length control protein FliK